MSKYFIFELDDDDDCAIEEFLDSADTYAEAVEKAKKYQKNNSNEVYFRLEDG